MMIHKKENHNVPRCTKFLSNSCDFPPKQCWYRHETSTEETGNKETHTDKAPELSSQSDFPVIKDQLKPPELKDVKEMLQVAMSMMNTINQKISMLN